MMRESIFTAKRTKDAKVLKLSLRSPRAWRFMFLLAIAASVLGRARQVSAQGGLALDNVRAVYVFGEQVTFEATIQASIPVQMISIVILDETGNIRLAQPLTIQADGATQFIFDARQNVLRPFATLRWRYDATFNDGSVVQSEIFSVRYDDNRFAWQRLESNGLRVFWFEGDAVFAQDALNAALEGVRIVNEFFPADLSQPIDIFIYPSQDKLAFLGVESTTTGYASPAQGVTLVVVEPGADQRLHMQQRLPHELMHVLLYRHLGAGYANVPVWLREGLATLVEINPTSDYDIALRFAATRDTLIPLMELCASFPLPSESAFLAYAESRSFTRYLRDTFGSSTVIELARRYADGVSCDRGVELVYDTSLVQLESRWRASILGETAWGAALQNLLPYLILLCMLIGIPLAIGLNTMRKKRR